MLSEKLNSSFDFSWKNLICCPQCGEKYKLNNNALSGKCENCHCPWSFEKNIMHWGNSENQHTIQKWKILFKKLKNQFYPTSSCFLPFRYITQLRVEKYYQRTLSDKMLAEKWSNHYLKDLDLKPGDVVLDHGCGRGRISALSSQKGFLTLGQDIQKNNWWLKIKNSGFLIVPPQFTKLPWGENSFSAIFNFGVLHYLDEVNLEKYAQEIFRVKMF